MAILQVLMMSVERFKRQRSLTEIRDSKMMIFMMVEK